MVCLCHMENWCARFSCRGSLRFPEVSFQLGELWNPVFKICHSFFFEKIGEPLENWCWSDNFMTICLSVFLENLGSGVKSRKLNMFKNVQNIFRSCDCSGKRNECSNQPPALCSQWVDSKWKARNSPRNWQAKPPEAGLKCGFIGAPSSKQPRELITGKFSIHKH